MAASKCALTIVKMFAVLAIVAAGFAFSHGRPDRFHPWWPVQTSTSTVLAFLTALAAALWAYDGWEDLNRVGSEIADPQRNIPRALIGGTLLVMGIYVLFNAVCFYVLPFAAVADPRT